MIIDPRHECVDFIFPYIIDDGLLARFRQLLERTGASVVLSSTWRCDPAGLFSAKHYGVPFIDITPDMQGDARSKEIVAWLWNHPEVTRYAVIDDEDDELDELPLFQPSSRIGLTEKIVEGVTDYLNGKTDKDMRRSRLVRVGIHRTPGLVRGIWLVEPDSGGSNERLLRIRFVCLFRQYTPCRPRPYL